ncbi:hypothetical protein FSP39_014522 [Pinctada imbricata]|uniref:DH domain-containing protein n=1 Tax=Pinctada imbricata TaxID=66713 RepID=A0AA88YD67_PINIB|nr:hypothetical protein FSP39_014522 [Pinctada imbricata]
MSSTMGRSYDIVGESCDARFPWQRDVSVQCDFAAPTQNGTCLKEKVSMTKIPLTNGSLQSSNFLSPTTFYSEFHTPFRGTKEKSHSIGNMESAATDKEFEKRRNDASKRARNSDSFLQLSPRNLRKHTSSIKERSVSDLMSISENASLDRGHSIDADSEVANICNELRRLALQSDRPLPSVAVLPSPRISPVMMNVTDDVNSDSDSGERFDTSPGRRRAFLKKGSSLSLASFSDEERVEPSPPISRRGRRAAIVETKNFGDLSPTPLPTEENGVSSDEGSGTSNGEEETQRSTNTRVSKLADLQERQRKLMKRNTVSDLYSSSLKNGSANSINDDFKKSKQSFSIRKLMKTRSKESLPRLEDALNQVKPSEFKDNHLSVYKGMHWSDLIASTDKNPEDLCLPETERKRREAVWELFKSECVYLLDHLMVLKHCFMEPIKQVQVEGYLMFVEPQDLFGNLDELCYVSYIFCKDFISALLKDMSSTEFGRTSILLSSFEKASIEKKTLFLISFITHSRDGGVYHTYCLNYTNALTYLEQLRQQEDFVEFEKWCCQDSRCNRLQLSDLLIAPMQHCTKLPLLLSNIRKYTKDAEEQKVLAELVEKVDSSLKIMEDKIKILKNYERLQEIQKQLVWPSVYDMDPRTYVPEFLRPTLREQPCQKILACPNRKLLHEGSVTLTEAAKTTDGYIFLFDDILLLTKLKKIQRKKHSLDSANVNLQTLGPSDKQAYHVWRSPIPLDRLSVHDVKIHDALASGLRNAFVMLQFNRFQQITGVNTIQCSSDVVKNIWLDKISKAKYSYKVSTSERNSICSDHSSLDSGGEMNVSTTDKPQSSHAKSHSLDAIYL